jgi:hypothetical protein
MASLSFTVEEALNILWANGKMPQGMQAIKADLDGVRVTVAGGIEILLQQESFSGGILRLSISSKSWAFKLADSLGKVDEKIDEAIRAFPFIRSEGKSLFINLDHVLGSMVKGIQIKDFKFSDGSIRIEF